MEKSQIDLILDHLRAGNSITPIEALERFGCFRLGARIWELRHAGFDIKDELVFKNGKHFSKYYLIPHEHQANLF